MFTGLIEAVGRVVEAIPSAGVIDLAIACPWSRDDLRHGESVAVDGVCLTVTDRGVERFHAQVVAETSARTTLGGAVAGRAVNLERSIRAGDRLGGHLVQGHVDGTSRVLALDRQEGNVRLRVALPHDLARYVARKGSIALQGVSLTVAERSAEAFEVALVPETLDRTTLGGLRPGDPVNVEVDVVARYLETLMEPSTRD